jgi:hypothetical protein
MCIILSECGKRLPSCTTNIRVDLLLKFEQTWRCYKGKEITIGHAEARTLASNLVSKLGQNVGFCCSVFVFRIGDQRSRQPLYPISFAELLAASTRDETPPVCEPRVRMRGTHARRVASLNLVDFNRRNLTEIRNVSSVQRIETDFFPVTENPIENRTFHSNAFHAVDVILKIVWRLRISLVRLMSARRSREIIFRCKESANNTRRHLN